MLCALPGVFPATSYRERYPVSRVNRNDCCWYVNMEAFVGRCRGCLVEGGVVSNGK